MSYKIVTVFKRPSTSISWFQANNLLDEKYIKTGKASPTYSVSDDGLYLTIELIFTNKDYFMDWSFDSELEEVRRAAMSYYNDSGIITVFSSREII
jgi:hypothetical protein